jgi:hypothetical protein
MLTLTAPSFGRVHTIRDHDRPCWCGAHHARDDVALGTPVDPAKYRYVDQAVWNHLAPALWKRTVQAIRRELARTLDLPRQRLSSVVRVRFVKASEFQRRGVVHYHAVVRLDGPDEACSAPPGTCTTDVLERVVRDAVRGVSATVPPSDALPTRLRQVSWGRQAEIVPLDPAEAGRAAGYIAKYATKTTEVVVNGVLLRRVRGRRDLAMLEMPTHAKELVEAAWHVGGVRGLEGARRWAHQFGYGGHTLTKSQGYSVTFGALREARSAWHDGRPPEAAGRVIRRGRLDYAGRGLPLAISLRDDIGRNLLEVGGRGS